MNSDNTHEGVVRCVDANFGSAIREWVDSPPELGGLYSRAGYALSQNAETGCLDLVLLLSEYPGVCFRPHHFEDVSLLDLHHAPQRRTPPMAVPGQSVGVGYPKLILRLCASVYQTEAISLEQGEPYVRIGYRSSLLRHPNLCAGVRCLPPVCRQMLVAAVVVAVQRTRFRMCLVWDRANCSFVELDGAVEESSEPPSGGILVTQNPVF